VKKLRRPPTFLENFRPDFKRGLHRLRNAVADQSAARVREISASARQPLATRGFDRSRRHGRLMSVTGLPGQGPLAWRSHRDLCGGIFAAYG